MSYPTTYRYAESHEWVRTEADDFVVGITAFAVESLQDLVFIDLPEVGSDVARGESFGEIESVKAVSELISPISGTVTAVNEALSDDLEVLAADPHGEGWLIRVSEATDAAAALAQLMDAQAYTEHTASTDH